MKKKKKDPPVPSEPTEAQSDPTPDAETPLPPVETPLAPATKQYVGTGFYWPVLFGLVLAVATLALVLQNTHRVDVHWLFFDFRSPLVVLLLATGLSAALLTELVGWVWRRRRRRALRDREELKRLRA